MTKNDIKTSEKLVELFAGNYDSKHKLNTTNKEMPIELLEKIDNGDVSFEVLNEYINRGYDIYTYRTQITIHGVCNKELNDRIGGYKNVIVNGNGSVGIKWVAIDRIKKNKIYNAIVKVFGYDWYIVNNSSLYRVELWKRLGDNADENKTIYNEMQKIVNRVGNDLFLGYIGIDKYVSIFNVSYYVLTIDINAIAENNVDEFLCRVLDKGSIGEVNDALTDYAKEEEKKRAEMEERMRKAREERERGKADSKIKAIEEYNALATKFDNDGYKRIDDLGSLKKDDKIVYLFIADNWNEYKTKLFFNYRVSRKMDMNGVLYAKDIMFGADKFSIKNKYLKKEYYGVWKIEK